MKITFLATELTDANITIKPIDLDIVPVLGDYIAIMDFIEDQQKEHFEKFLTDSNKINLASVDGRIWNKIDGDNVLQLSLYFDDDK